MPGKLAASWASGMCSRGAYAGWEAPSASTRSSSTRAPARICGPNRWTSTKSTLATVQDNFGIANRLARTLSVELVNVEGRRAPRADPDAVDLTMRGWSVLNGGPNKEDVQRSVALFEEALRIDPENSQARVGLAQALTLVYRNRWDPEPAKVLARADEAATRAIAAAPNNAHAHYVKAEVLGLSNRFDAALATYDRAIALDPNYAAAYVGRARNLNVIGRAAEALAPVERAIRLSPRDPELVRLVFRPLPREHAPGA